MSETRDRLRKLASRVRDEVRKGNIQAYQVREFIPTPEQYAAGLTRGNEALLRRTGYTVTSYPPAHLPAILAKSIGPSTHKLSKEIYMPFGMPPILTNGLHGAEQQRMRDLILRHEVDEARTMPSDRTIERAQKRIKSGVEESFHGLGAVLGGLAFNAPRSMWRGAKRTYRGASSAMDGGQEFAGKKRFSSHNTAEVVRREAGHANFLDDHVIGRMREIRRPEMYAIARHLKNQGISWDPEAAQGYEHLPALRRKTLESAIAKAPMQASGVAGAKVSLGDVLRSAWAILRAKHNL